MSRLSRETANMVIVMLIISTVLIVAANFISRPWMRAVVFWCGAVGVLFSCLLVAVGESYE